MEEVIDHPTEMFVSTLVNTASGFGFLVLGAGVIPRLRLEIWMRWAAVVFAVAAGLSDLALAWMMLWYPGFTMQNIADSTPTLLFMSVSAIGIWVVLTGAYILSEAERYRSEKADLTQDPTLPPDYDEDYEEPPRSGATA